MKQIAALSILLLVAAGYAAESGAELQVEPESIRVRAEPDARTISFDITLTNPGDRSVFALTVYPDWIVADASRVSLGPKEIRDAVVRCGRGIGR